MKARALWAVGLALAAVLLHASAAWSGTTERVSVASDGSQADSYSMDCSISADGRFVAFSSFASNLVPPDGNDDADIFVRDRGTATISPSTIRVTMAFGGGDPDDYSSSPAISADGQWVAFGSVATNLIGAGEDTNGARDVFVWEQVTKQITRVSVGPGGLQADGTSAGWGCAISGDGQRIAFDSRATNLADKVTDGTLNIFVRDRTSNQTILASVAANGVDLANGPSIYAAISADGRYVPFVSDATNLVEGDTNGVRDVFVRDLQEGVTKRVSVGPDGAQANDLSRWRPALSADGRYIAFSSAANNLVPQNNKKRMAFNIYVHDQQEGETTRVSVSSDGKPGRLTSWYPAISADGRYVAFDSAHDFVPNDTNPGRDVFVHDRGTGQTTLVSVASDGTQGDYVSWLSAISAGGRFVAFESSASNLVPDDTNDAGDVFVHDRTGAPPPTGSIAGTVTDSSDGSPPIGGAIVSTDTGQSDTTAGDGSYTINGVPVGDHTVTASADGYAQQQKPATVAEDATTPIDFALDPAQEPTDVFVAEIVYAPAGPKGKDLDVTVVLLDNLDQPVAGASVSIEVALGDDSYDSRTGATGEDGTVTFKLRNAPLGTYTTTVTAVDAGALIWEELTPPNTFTK